MKPTLAIFGNVIAMPPDAQRAILAQMSAVSALAAAGMAPADAVRAAYNGQPTIAPVIDGDRATIAVHGPLIARAPWYAKAYMEAIDPFDVAAVFDALAYDPQFTAVKTVVVEVDCCGGTVTGAGEIAAALGRLQASGRTVEVRVEGVCASAAYRAFCGADRILASPDSLVGSIGVYVVLEDEAAAQAAEGCKPEVISSSPLKGLGADGRVTPELRQETQRRVDAHAQVFYDAVAAARGLTGPALAAVTTGQVWLAKEAQALRLIDAVATLAETPADPAQDTPPAPVPPTLGSESDDDAEATAAATPTNPRAAIPSPTPMESVMDVKCQAALAALTTTHPALASALVAEAVKPGATAEGLEAFALKATAQAKDAEIAALKADLAKAQAQATTATAAAEKLGAHIPTHKDPGQGAPAAQTVTRAEFNANPRAFAQALALKTLKIID